MLYHAYQLASDSLAPWQALAQYNSAASWWGQTERTLLRQFSAANRVFAQLKFTHGRPDYDLDAVDVDGQLMPVTQTVVASKPFASLLQFKRATSGHQQLPKVLLMAPLSGHFATLLRDTLRTLLQDHDVYMTDWHNARDVPLHAGVFGFDDYVDYMVQFLRMLGPGTHVMAVCQPCPATLAATALLAEDDDPAQPLSLTLMAGPVDCRINPTEVNKLATSKPIDWFEKNLISHVPLPHRGFMRRVYPGFVQLSAFMSMNLDRHQDSFTDLYHHLCQGEMDKATTTEVFYKEYFAVNDLPAEFYLETVERIFQTHDLPRGVLTVKGRVVDPRAIRRAALLTVEGERDDICAVGQTVAAQDLCSSIRPYKKVHHVQTGVGHYGVFNGRKWQQQIYPRVRELIHASQG
ncbi:polyhydroxyalkanoate depolymerase [Lampropedia puyangensis]|uniref:Polyhydroxyalkanoate depolymerase n=1 Tax=Lampropedia puyangensis TaxID=1330072 RepID=A0A4V4GQS7_9BURK|nr:polyhydroxyalkanoate depolymerase [Lampropedia puyangensis]THT98695.1 polyhydroxyalkanoate depolymerase [Lampropedia puyangensis]